MGSPDAPAHMMDDDGRPVSPLPARRTAPLKLSLREDGGYKLEDLRLFVKILDDQEFSDKTPIEARVSFGGKLRELRAERK